MQWDSIYDMYKRSLVKLVYNIASNNMPAMVSDLVVWRKSPYNLRGHNKAIVPRFTTKVFFHEKFYLLQRSCTVELCLRLF